MTTSKGSLRVCNNGHEYYKSSDCPVCPTCEQERKPTMDFLQSFRHLREERWNIMASQRCNYYPHIVKKRF